MRPTGEAKHPSCPAAGNNGGLGCPECLRFEVRPHEVDCAMHSGHLELSCCWCGEIFFAFIEVKHLKPEAIQ